MGQIGFVVEELKNVQQVKVSNSPEPINIMNVICVVNHKWESTSFAYCRDLTARIGLLRELGIGAETIEAALKAFPPTS